MKPISALYSLGLLLLTASCGDQPLPQVLPETVIATCGTIGNGLKLAAPMEAAGVLSPAQEALVTEADTKAKPYCGPGAVLPTDLASVMLVLAPLAANLTSITGAK